MASHQYAVAVETKDAANAFFKAGDNESAVQKWNEALSELAPVIQIPQRLHAVFDHR